MLPFLPPPFDSTVSSTAQKGWNKLISIVNTEVLQRFYKGFTKNSAFSASGHHTELPICCSDKVYTKTNQNLIQGVMHSKSPQRKQAHMAVLIIISGSTTKHCCWDQQQCSTMAAQEGKKSTLKAREYHC